MKINLKTISLIVLLGVLFTFLGHRDKTNKSIAPIVNQQEEPTILDKKTNSANSPAPKVYISVPPVQNGLGIGNNWKSR